MKSIFVVPVVATMLLAGIAIGHNALYADESKPGDMMAAADADPANGPDGQDHKWHHHHFHGGPFHHHDPLADVPKPYTADSVKQAMEAFFAKRPQVKSVTESGPNILVVEIVDPEGKSHRFELNKTTGERRPAW